MDIDSRIKNLQAIAHDRWLSPEEIYEVIRTVDVSNLPYEWHQLPQNGQIYIFDRAKFPNFKDDGIEWMKKKSTNTVQEQYLKLLINGVHAIIGQYSTCAADNVSSSPLSYLLWAMTYNCWIEFSTALLSPDRRPQYCDTRALS